MKPSGLWRGANLPKIKSTLRLPVAIVFAFSLFAATSLVVTTTLISTSARAEQSLKEKFEEWLKYILTVGGSSLLPFEDPLLNLDEVTCGWAITTLNEKLQELSFIPDPDSQILEKIKRVSDAKTLFESKCGHKAVEVPPPPPAAPPPPATPPDGPGAFHPRPGWTIDQEICARRCIDLYTAYLKAARSEEGRRQSADTAKGVADESVQKAADLDKKAADAEQEHAAARKTLRSTPPGTPTPREIEELGRLNRVANRDVDGLLAEAKKAHADTNEKTARAKSLADLAIQARIELDAARAAYNDCVKRCINEAMKVAKPKVWSGTWHNTKGQSGSSTVTIKELDGNVEVTEKDFAQAINARRAGNIITWENRNDEGCRDYQASFEIHQDGKTASGTYSVVDRCRSPSSYSGTYDAYTLTSE